VTDDIGFSYDIKIYRGFSKWLNVSELPVRASLEMHGLLV